MRQSKQNFQPFFLDDNNTTSNKQIPQYSLQLFLFLPLSLFPPSVFFSHYFIIIRHADLAALCQDPRTLILYPGPKSQDLEELVQNQEVGTVEHNVIIIDGTWSQAKNIFLKNSLFHLPKQVCNSSCDLFQKNKNKKHVK